MPRSAWPTAGTAHWRRGSGRLLRPVRDLRTRGQGADPGAVVYDAVEAALEQNVDVLIESYRPGVAKRIGVGYEELSQINPRLVYCSTSGYGDRKSVV